VPRQDPLHRDVVDQGYQSEQGERDKKRVREAKGSATNRLVCRWSHQDPGEDKEKGHVKRIDGIEEKSGRESMTGDHEEDAEPTCVIV
jgi:hypothetical protein